MNTLKEGLFRRLIRTHIEGEAAKRYLFESLLNEDGVGTEFDKAEEEAKSAYEAAKAALDRWTQNKEKKGAYDAAFSKLRAKGYGEDRARAELLKDPRYAYNTVLNAKKRETLEAELDKAEARYASYNPEVRGYRRTKKFGAKTIADKQMPKKTAKRSILDITKTSFMTWHKWPAQIKKTNLSYGSKSAGEDVEQAALGTGPGEEWIAHIFGGQVQGGGVSFDVVMPDGSAWEIKQLLRSSDTIRPGTEGRQAFEGAKNHLNAIVKQIKNFTKVATKIGLADRLGSDDKKKLEFVKTFIDDEAEMILGKGEVSKERFIDLRSVLITLSKLKALNAESLGEKGSSPELTVGLNDKQIAVDRPTFIDVAKRVEKATKREDILSQFEELDIALATLKDAAFDDPRSFFNEWFSSIKIDRVFSQVDGVIIVNPQGFMIVPKDQLQTTIKFDKITQGQPRFVLSNFGAGP